MDSATPRKTVRFAKQDNAYVDGESVNNETVPAGTPLGSTGTLKVHPDLKNGSILGWDIMLMNPDEIAAKLSDGGNSTAAWHFGADGSVPLKQLVLKHDAIPPWPLHIKSDTADSDGVTVLKLLSALYEHLHKNVSPEYYTTEPANVQAAALKAYRNRKQAGGAGMLRIDFLPGHQFVGLRIKPDSQANAKGVWEFTFDVEPVDAPLHVET